MAARLLLVAALLAARPAAASLQRPPDDEGLFFGVRGGWAVPFGDLEPGQAVSELADSKLPLGLELGYRFTGHVRGALYFELAPMSLASCPTGAACSAFDVRFGVALQLHAAPRSWIDPWLGVGLGIEHARATAPPPGGVPEAWELSWSGLEVPVEVGVDLALSEYVALGPYAAASAAQFTSKTEHPPGEATTSSDVHDRATHGWIEAGLRLTVKL